MQEGNLMLAISTMGTTPTAIFFVLAVVACLLAAVRASWAPVEWLPVGLGLFLFVVAWNATAAT